MSSTLWSAAQILVGIGMLALGGELLVRGASNLAAALRISPLVIGLTVVAFGTSAPELAVTVQAAIDGSPELAVGNVVGSNIANVLLILGISALIAPLDVHSRVVRIDVPLMIAASVAVWLLALGGTLSRLDGILLLSVLIAYTVWSLLQGKKEPPEVHTEYAQAVPKPDRGATHLALHGAEVLGGLVLLAVGARWLVTGASEIARALGVGELAIGLTVVAVGTSLPELVASVAASLKGQKDIAVGNVVGSNLFNLLGVLALGAIAAPHGIPVAEQAARLDLPIMIASALACLPIFFTGWRIDRIEGAVLLAYFCAYTAYVVMGAIESEHRRSFELAMLGFVLPLTLIAVGFGVRNAIRSGQEGPR